jgi:hypothetical protein
MPIYQLPEIGLSIEDVIDSQLTYLEDLCGIFQRLFPQYAHRSFRIREKAAHPANYNPNFIEHQWLLRVHEQPAAMASFKFNLKRGVGMGVYVGILPEYRQVQLPDGRNLSHYMMDAVNQQFKKDAGPAPMPGYVVEVDSAKLVRRYQDYGFVRLPVHYQEPNLSSTAPDASTEANFHPAYLGIFPLDQTQPFESTPEFTRLAVLAWLVDLYCLPEEHPVVRQVLDSIHHFTNEEDLP